MIHMYSTVPSMSHQTKVNIGLHDTYVFYGAIYSHQTKVNIGLHDTYVFSCAIYITPD